MNPQDLDRLLRPLQLKDLRALCRARGLNPGGGKEELTEHLKENMQATGNYSMVIPTDPKGDPNSVYAQPYGAAQQAAAYTYGGTPERQATTGVNNNNYSRPSGMQNVGNFITDKPSSRVLAPPGGGSSIQLGGYGGPPERANTYGSPPPAQYGAPPRASSRESPMMPSYGTPGNGGNMASIMGMGMGGGGPDVGGSAHPNYTYGSTPERHGPGIGVNNNNYSRPSGQQNVGNFITDKPSSRVLAPPGGGSSITFGDYVPPHMQAVAASHQRSPAPPVAPPSYSSPYGAGGGMGGGGRTSDPASGMGAMPMTSGYGGGSGPAPGGAAYGHYAGSVDPYAYDVNKPLAGGGAGIPIPAGYDAHFNPVQAPGAMPGQRIPSAGRRAGKPQPGAGESILSGNYPADSAALDRRNDYRTNNYARPSGQNVGNHITDRPSSRVLAPPGGRSQISFG